MSDDVLDLLRRAIDAQDTTQLDDAMARAYRAFGMHLDGADIDLVPSLVAILQSSWATNHEDVARHLQTARDPRAIDALYETAVRCIGDEMRYALARKCTWALADIGTPDARHKLELLAQIDDTEIAGYAQRHLDRWQAELDRKRGPRSR